MTFLVEGATDSWLGICDQALAYCPADLERVRMAFREGKRQGAKCTASQRAVCS